MRKKGGRELRVRFEKGVGEDFVRATTSSTRDYEREAEILREREGGRDREGQEEIGSL